MLLHKILLIVNLLLAQVLFGQANDIWVRFTNAKTELSGYKDLKGNTKIPAKFTNMISADTFYNIIAVNESIDTSYRSYYLLKDGRQVGEDSVFMFDYTYDCESEGKILYKDYRKDRVGFFDKNGVAIIPAIYNYASPFRNGLAVALRNAKRKCWGRGEDTLNCEHLIWDGGESVLINEKNEILVDSLAEADLDNINWYSLKINSPSADTGIFITLKGKNGNIYSFVNFEKEFEKWFRSEFLVALRSANNTPLKKLFFSEISFQNGNGWQSLSKDDYVRSFPNAVTRERFEEANLKKIAIGPEFDPFISDIKIPLVFYDACGSHLREKFPVFGVRLSYYKKRSKELTLPARGTEKMGREDPSEFEKTYEIANQDDFKFIRTPEGYRLLSVSLKQ